MKSDFVRRYRTAIFAVVLLVFFALVIFFTKDIQRLVVNTTVDARFWPKVIGIGGCVLSAMLFIQGMVEGNALKKREEEGLAEKPPKGEGMLKGDGLRTLLTLVLMFFYIAGLQTFGFIVMTLAYLFLQFMLLSEPENRKILRLIVITVLFTAIVYLLFRNVFQMMLPTGSIWG